MKCLWKVLPLIAACLLATASAHNINVQVWLNPAPLSARESAAYAALEQLGLQHQFTVDSSSSPLSLEASSLQNAQVLLFLNRNGAGLNATQRDDVENFVGAGGGFIAIRDGLLPEASWTRFDSIIGATVGNVLPSQQMTVLNPDKAHAATRELPFRYDWTSPWYDFVEGPRGNAHVLLSVRKLPGSSFTGEHPVSWAKLFGRGRVFATSLGASAADFNDGYFQEHLLGAIEWCGGAMDGDVRVTDDAAFDLAILADNIEACMAIDIADDGRIFYVEKKGRIFRWDPVSQSSKKLLDWSNTGTQHKVYFPFENGLFGMALDPDFPQKPYIYIHYSFTGSDPWGPGTGQHRVSRLELIGDSIVENSEEVFLEYDFDRDAQIHSGGCLGFDNAGNLLIATGDNTSYGVGATKNPFNPADPRPGNAIYDAQRTSANTADFRGKILRIRPSASIGGGYSLPAGNLFTESDSTFGEIYLMGVRNPFKFCVDPATGWLAWGDVGPDATAADSLRGPMGRDEYNLAKSAGNYGWPYMLANNLPYREYDYDADSSGSWFDPNNLRNRSPNSDGIVNLPPARPAILWEDKNLPSPEWPEFGTGNITALAGTFYRYDSTITDPNKLPQYYDGTLFVMDWTRDWIKAVRLDSAGEVVKISPFIDSLKVLGPMDMKIGPDGAIYLMEWRTDKWGGLSSRIVRIRYAPDGRSPIAIIEADRDNGLATLVVNFDGSRSYDPDKQALSYTWDFGDGSAVETGAQVTHNYRNPGVYSARLDVENTSGNIGSAQITITAGNNRPEVEIEFPVHGGLFGWGETIDFSYSISDDQDGNTGEGSINCSDAEARVLVGHDAHAHPSVPFTTCKGSFSPSSEGHVTTDDELFLLFEASYTDVAPFQSGACAGQPFICFSRN
ncbi:MAG: ThuA domain-containing protein [Bacteroidia bacterium]